jgi:hypothetical protein
MKRYTTSDIAEAVGVRPSTIRAYHSRGQMPPPTGHVGATPYWEPKDIEPWIKERNSTVKRWVAEDMKRLKTDRQPTP